jgi:hypothetical protein
LEGLGGVVNAGKLKIRFSVLPNGSVAFATADPASAVRFAGLIEHAIIELEKSRGKVSMQMFLDATTPDMRHAVERELARLSESATGHIVPETPEQCTGE